ncbi:MAG TPA: CDP-alcohol phosphatidyltransferase family protein [Patescibacteria group bacterium]|nr:CDP-alcohol phosphatidyltransferase family protein [Patescibacteria group bacterium]
MKRINFSFTARIEVKILDWMVRRIPAWVSPDMLTALAILASILAGILYIFVSKNNLLLLLINLCLILHWWADSLDGRIARYRKKTRPHYGYYVDHILDSLSVAIVIGGITASTLTYTTSWVWVLSCMLLSMIHVFLKAKVYKIFEFSIQNVGPTEARISLFLINLILLFTGNPEFFVVFTAMTLLDIIGWVIVLCFLIILIPELIHTAIRLDREDRKQITS